MLLLYHKFIKNARNVFLRGMILCFAVGLQNDKIFYIWNLSSKKSLIFASELLPIVVPVGLFLCFFALLSFYRALEFSSSFRCWFFIVFFLANTIFNTSSFTFLTKNSQTFLKAHVFSVNTRHRLKYLLHDEMSTHAFVSSQSANERKLQFFLVAKL